MRLLNEEHAPAVPRALHVFYFDFCPWWLRNEMAWRFWATLRFRSAWSEATGGDRNVFVEMVYGPDVGDPPEPLAGLRVLEDRVVVQDLRQAVPGLSADDLGHHLHHAAELRIRHGFVLAIDARPGSPAAVVACSFSTARASARVKAAARRAGLGSHVSPHSLRHAHASHAIENGASIALVSATLGHSDLKVTSVYAHARPEDSSSRFLKR